MMFWSLAGADPEHCGRGEQEDRGGRMPVLQTGPDLPRREPEITRNPTVPLHILPWRAQEQQGPGSSTLLCCKPFLLGITNALSHPKSYRPYRSIGLL